MSRVLLTMPLVQADALTKKLVKSSCTPPLGIGYIASYLRSKGHVVDIFDGAVLDVDSEDLIIRKKLKDFKPNIVGVSAVTITFQKAIKTAEVVKTYDKDIITVIGGPHVTALPIESMNASTDIDVVIVGEGELTTLELVEKIESNESLDSVKGIAYRENGKPRLNPPREFIKDLDILPFPARDLFPDLSLYYYGKYKREPVITMMSSRGCPNRCTFCDRSVHGNKYRAFSAEYVIEEIRHVIDKYGAREIQFNDDFFTKDERRLTEICKKINEENFDIVWSCSSRVNIKPHLFKIMKDSGCWKVCFGIESGNQKVLNSIKKGITLSQVERAVWAAYESGIRVTGSFIIGHPLDTPKTVEQTIAFAKKLPLYVAHFMLAVPYPGSELSDIARDTGIFHATDYSDYYTFTDEPIYIPNGLAPEFMVEAQNRAYREFYINRDYIWRLIKSKSTRDVDEIRYLMRGCIPIVKSLIKEFLKCKR